MTSLDLHVFGGVEGESIIVRFPTGAWGLIDCYCENHRDSATNRPLEFLTKNRVQELAFVCLTHPHLDHFLGIRQILETLPVRQFWYSAGLTNDNLQALIKWRIKRYEKRNLFVGDNKTDELQNLWAKVFELRGRRALKTVALMMGTEISNCHSDFGVSIKSFAPSTRQSERYQNIFASAYDEFGNRRRKYRNSELNIVSIGISIQFGNSVVVLGGDVESPGWRDASADYPALISEATLIKVPHHGSNDSYDDNSWKLLTGTAKQSVAVLTPYEKYGLPLRTIVEKLKASCSRVYTASVSAVPWATVPAPIGLSIANNTVKVSHNPSSHCGRCSFEVGQQKTVINEAVDGAAGRL